MNEEYIPYEGEYEKVWYDIKLPDGTIHKHCWPNAGYMNAIHTDSTRYAPGECLYRLSTTNPLDQEEQDIREAIKLAKKKFDKQQ